jgi:flagellum-specific ATP synthase
VRIGAYKPGADLDLDRALRGRQAMRTFMTQGSLEKVSLDQSIERLEALAGGI